MGKFSGRTSDENATIWTSLAGGEGDDLFSAASQKPDEETPTALKICRERRGGGHERATNPRIRAPSERGRAPVFPNWPGSTGGAGVCATVAVKKIINEKEPQILKAWPDCVFFCWLKIVLFCVVFF